MTRIASKCLLPSTLQVMIQVPKKVLNYVSSIKKLTVSKVEYFLKLNFDLKLYCETVLAQNH